MKGAHKTRHGTFRARIRVGEKVLQLGSFPTEEEAGAAFLEAEKLRSQGREIPLPEKPDGAEEEVLRAKFDYDPETGRFTYRQVKGCTAVGKDVTHVSLRGYVTLSSGRKTYQAHRVAWLFMTGHWPEADIDHINRIRTDNRFCNLREATRSQNLANCPVRSDSSTGFKGVHKKPGNRAKPFWATIKSNGEVRHLGYYATAEAAHEAYMQAAKQIYGKFASSG